MFGIEDIFEEEIEDFNNYVFDKMLNNLFNEDEDK